MITQLMRSCGGCGNVFRHCRVNFSAVSSSCRILGIETSCDDTGVAIVDQDGVIIGESLYSQQSIHSAMGGIIPPLAKELHANNIKSAVDDALSNARMGLSEVDAFAVTVKPGLPMSLSVGMNYGKQLSISTKRPFIPIHHMEAHALTIRVVEKIDFPFLVMLISGGHSLLAVAQDIDQYILLGKTFDDAPGEAIDKIARRLKLTNLAEFAKLSGGRAMELASQRGDLMSFPIAEPLLKKKDCNFSFAGIKNSAREAILKEEAKHGIEGDEILPSVYDLCASVQLAVAKHLGRRLQRAIEFCKFSGLIDGCKQNLVVSGGVACNQFICNSLKNICLEKGYGFHVPPPKLCTDNGVMIAWNGVEKWKLQKNIFPYTELDKVDIQGKCSFGRELDSSQAMENLEIKWIPAKRLYLEQS